MRRRSKVDANQAAIVSALRKAGALVQLLHRVGEGCPDLLVCITGNLFLVEVKDGSKPPSARALTPPQVEFHARWPVHVLMDAETAVHWARSMRTA